MRAVHIGHTRLDDVPRPLYERVEALTTLMPVDLDQGLLVELGWTQGRHEC